MKKILFSTLAASMLFVNLANAKEYVLDTAHTEVGFKVKHMQVSNTKGNFGEFSGELDFDTDKRVLNKLNAVIKMNSINTNNDKRDDHLRTAEFFDVEKYPEMKFEMTKFIPDSDDSDEGKVIGNLTIKDVTKEIELDYEFGGLAKNEQIDKVGFTLEGEIDRTAFNVGDAGFAIGSNVKIEIEVEADAK
ncbi:MAG: polyisoprenoid-binding protein [Campylobacteraceae bacterium]|nr:polyisoprenoid-binding protein [Campylobacteraceae bacterium]